MYRIKLHQQVRGLSQSLCGIEVQLDKLTDKLLGREYTEEVKQINESIEKTRELLEEMQEELGYFR